MQHAPTRGLAPRAQASEPHDRTTTPVVSEKQPLGAAPTPRLAVDEVALHRLYLARLPAG